MVDLQRCASFSTTCSLTLCLNCSILSQNEHFHLESAVTAILYHGLTELLWKCKCCYFSSNNTFCLRSGHLVANNSFVVCFFIRPHACCQVVECCRFLPVHGSESSTVWTHLRPVLRSGCTHNNLSLVSALVKCFCDVFVVSVACWCVTVLVFWATRSVCNSF